MKKSFGFTLAEVLITLGIIGVVAAMTMPTLMNSTQGAQYKAAYKKALSAIAQGVTLNVALDGASFADAVAGTVGSTAKPAAGDSVASILGTRMNVVNATTAADSGYGVGEDGTTSTFPTVSIAGCVEAGKNPGDTGCTAKNDPIAPDTFLFFNDGSMFTFDSTKAISCTGDEVAGVKKCYGAIDVNGLKGPNKVVACDASTGPCVVSNPTDIYPVEFYDQTILPASDAARAVLYGK